MTITGQIVIVAILLAVIAFLGVQLRIFADRIDTLKDMMCKKIDEAYRARVDAIELRSEVIVLKMRLERRPTLRRRLRYLFTGKLP